jgi:hypothetical protein
MKRLLNAAVWSLVLIGLVCAGAGCKRKGGDGNSGTHTHEDKTTHADNDKHSH